MVDLYRTSCSSCKAFFEVKYGTKDKNNIYEIYSCPTCKNLFSLSNIDPDFSCPNCKSKELKKYNMNKEKNISYYKKLFAAGQLTKKKYQILVNYWSHVLSKTCPKCGRDTLTWQLYEKKIKTL